MLQGGWVTSSMAKAKAVRCIDFFCSRISSTVSVLRLALTRTCISDHIMAEVDIGRRD